ncbi:Signal transduction histidine-protein kinase/phosphatase DegS [Candidatus Thermoflexus japonica]|uniref:Oxygen sensor histidine kinase NreB n=1 Tax=Candidatus Thermoflexus japonica TaxID=2035417 RepID=A0A2H5Y9U9_9CHLR|nr:Signal transduction histidine-protein kinase/phosphatase DegS [Candidatus Thermoflexus japonica]
MTGQTTPLQDLANYCREEQEAVQRQLSELQALIRQTSTDIERLAQRSLHLTNQIKQMESRPESIPPAEIIEAYQSAMDVQKRLWLMRGQLEKFQGLEAQLQRYLETLDRVLSILATVQEEISAPRPGMEPGLIVRLFEAQEQERQRLVRQLHDGPAQALTNLVLQAEICERLFQRDPERAKAELAALKSSVVETFQRMREFLFDIRPMSLDDLGLVPTVRRYVEALKDKVKFSLSLQITGEERRLAAHQEAVLFRIVQELLTNVRLHAQASQAVVRLAFQPHGVRLDVEDNGVGFDVEEALANAPRRKTIGLTSIRQWVEMLGGQLSITSAPGKGTQVMVFLPS